MSWLSSFIKNPIQPITHAIGKTVGVTANLNNGIHIDPKKLALTAGALALPGVGSLIGKGLGELGGALGAIPGVGAIEGALGSAGSAINSIPGVSSIEDLLKSGGSKVAGLLTGGDSSGALGQGSGGLLGSIEGLLTGNGGINALGIAQGINAASLGKQSSDYAKDALGSATSAYNDKAPLRVAGQAGLLNPQAQDLSGLTASRNALNTSVPDTRNLPGAANPQALQSIMALLNPNAGQGVTSTALADPSSLQNVGQARANPRNLQSVAALLQPQNANDKLGNIANANTFARAA